VSRATLDVDLLVLAPECLDAPLWQPLRGSGADVSVRPGGPDDPLAGVVRITAPGQHPLDVVVGRSHWQASVLAGARDAVLEGVRVPVASAAGLILLKLYAGGPQDAWDIAQLLGGPDRAALVREVEASLAALPPECRRLWARTLDAAPG
jgi:hypothetical protein